MASADLVLHNARIYTVDPSRPTAEAVAVDDGRFVEVGSNEHIRRAYSAERQIDAAGRTVVPGFIDAHAHLQELGLALRRADLTDTASPADVVNRLNTFVAEHDVPDDAWVRGHGWDQTEWSPPRLPSRETLDGAFPERPVWVTRTDVHAGWANTAALEATVGLEQLRRMDDPAGGRICRDESGRPTGVLVDDAMQLVEDEMPAPSDERLSRAVRAALDHAASRGVTGLHDAGVDLETLRRYRQFIDEGAFPLRVYAMVEGGGDAFDYFCGQGPFRHDSGRLDVASVKFFADGALGSRGAALLDDYADEAGNRGFLLHDYDEFCRKVESAVECGFQVNTHAIGDRANRMVLDAYETAAAAASAPLRRPRIEHAQIVHPDDQVRFGELDAIASVQPAFAVSDMHWAPERLGPDRLGGAYAWKTLQDAGARLAFGSDAPVEPLDPLRTLHAAVTRQDERGRPRHGWRPGERISRETALWAHTLGAAYASFWEESLGSIEGGKRADFVVLSEDPLRAPAVRLLDADVLATYIDGRPVHTRSAWPVA